MAYLDDQKRRAKVSAQMSKQFGPDWYNRSIQTSVGSWNLRDIFWELGIPLREPPGEDHGLYQLRGH